MDFYTYAIRTQAVELADTHIKCISPTATVSDALYLLMASDKSCLAVTENGHRDGHFISLFTYEDVQRSYSSIQEESYQNTSKIRIAELLWGDFAPTGEGTALAKDDDLLSAVEIFTVPHRQILHEQYIKLLPIVDDTHRLLGVLSYRAILNKLLDETLVFPNHRVQSAMLSNKFNHPIRVCFSHSSLSDVFTYMQFAKEFMLPVVTDQDPLIVVGIITQRQIYSILSQLPRYDIPTTFVNDPAVMIKASRQYFALPRWDLKVATTHLLNHINCDALIVVKTLRSRQLVGILSYVEILSMLIA